MKASPKDILLEDGCGGVLEAGADVEHHEIEDSICTVRRSDWAKKGTIAGFQRGGGLQKWDLQKSEPSTYISQIPTNGTDTQRL